MSFLQLSIASAGGLGLGVVYLSCLWFTLCALPRVNQPMTFLIGTTAARFGLLFAGFYVISGGRGDMLLTSLFGFFLVRILALRWIKAGIPNRPAAL